MTSSCVVVGDALLDPATGETAGPAAVVIDNGRVTAAGRREAVSFPRDAQVVDGAGLTLLPGLIDTHVHLSMRGDGINMQELLMTHPSLAVLGAVPACAATLNAGFTTVRDAGYTPAGVRQAVERGYFPGPRMLLTISMLCQTGGHGDNIFPCGAAIPIAAGALIPESMVDGADEMRKRVRTILREGADWVKICTSGGVMSPGDPDAPHHPHFTLAEIRAAVEEAGAQGRKVMAHAQSTLGIKNALEGGVATIEHGIWLDDDAIAFMAAEDRALVPTLVAVLAVIRHAEAGRMPPWAGPKAKLVSADHKASVTRAIEAGVTVALGTDSGIGPHGGNGEELLLLQEAGLSPLDCVRAATSVAADVIGLSGQAGTLRAGAFGDVIGVRGDPLDDLAALAAPENVRVVVKGGAVVKQPG